MIISHRHNFIFVAIPKTGTHSVRRALRATLGPDDLEQVGLFVQKVLPFPPIAELGHGHISLAQIRPFLRAEDFSSYFKFAFVRNPFDRFVSYCAFMTRENHEFEHNPRAVMRHFLFTDRPVNHILFWPQHVFITDAAGTLLTSMIGRVETMQTSYEAICRNVGVEAAGLERVNDSRHGDYRRYYDYALADAVAEYYRKDLDLFGYEFDSGA